MAKELVSLLNIFPRETHENLITSFLNIAYKAGKEEGYEEGKQNGYSKAIRDAEYDRYE